MKTTFLTLSVLVLGISAIQAQTSVNTAGDVATSSSGNVSYSLGQAFQDVRSNSSVSVSEGVQQPYEITVTLGVNVSEVNLNLQVFPNPTQDILNLKVDFSDYTNYNYELYDASNKVLISKSIASKNTALSIATFPSAVYYLKVTKMGKPIKVFKVIKTDK